MKKLNYIPSFIVAVLALTSCHHDSSDMDLVEEMVLMRPWETEYQVGSAQDTVPLVIMSNSSWKAQANDWWVELSDESGTGNDTIYAYIAANRASCPRSSSINVSLTYNPQKQFNYSISQQSYQSLLSVAGHEKGAGFAYDVKASYCKGMTWQIFNIKALDYYQYLPDADGNILQYGTFITDNAEAYGEEQFVSGSTLEEVSQEMSAAATLDLNVYVADLEVSGNVHLSNLTSHETIYAVKRTKRITFVRDIQYANCVAAVKAGWTNLFTPAFYEDWKVLEAQSKGSPNDMQCEKFLDKWGVAFVSRACLGGSLDYEMQIEKQILKNGITVEAAVDASLLGSVLEFQGQAKWQDMYEKIKNYYSADLHVYGGNVQLISIVADRSHALSQEHFNNWLNSITYGTALNDPATNNAVLIDVKIVSIANLFTGETRKVLQSIISKRFQ